MYKLIKLLLSGFFIAAMSISTTAQAHVLDGAKEWNGHYYKIIAMRMTWDKAEKFCNSIGGHLATAETFDENEMIKTMVLKYDNNRKDRYWIGGYCKDSIWRWVTGKLITDYFDWISSPASGDNKRIELVCREEARWHSDFGDEHEFLCEWEKADDAHESTL